MLFSSYAIATTALAAFAAAQYPNAFSVPPEGFSFKAGHTVNLTWTILAGETVTLTLRSGASNTLNTGTTIVSGLENKGSYLWTIPSDTVKGDEYTLEIVDDDNVNIINYTPQFPIDSNVLSSAAASAAASTSGAAASTTTDDATTTTDTTSTTRTTSTAKSKSTTLIKGSHNSTVAAASTTMGSAPTSTSTDETATTTSSSGSALLQPVLGGSFLAMFAFVIGL